MKNNKAFTLVELLIVISIVAILASVLLSVVNPERQRNIAKDSVNKATMYKIAESVESYRIITNSTTYPPMLFNNNLPAFQLLSISAGDLPANLNYLKNSDNTNFCICIPGLVNKNIYFWYKSSTKKIEELTTACTTACN